MIPYLIVGYDILLKALKGLKNRQPFDECFLMAFATIGAIVLGLTSTGDYVEAVAVMLFYQIGEWFQSYAVGKSRKNINELMDIRPDYANIEGEDGLEQVDPDDVEIGTIIVVQPGEKIPIDGRVIEGTSFLDTSALTGESVYRQVGPGDDVISGCINNSALLRIETTREFGESTVSKILDLVENATSRKSNQENFISRFARVYTPAVVYSAIALAFLPPLFLMISGRDPLWSTWIYRALTFLVISCPCALVISIPLTFFAGIGGASNAGVLVKGSNYLEALSKTKTVMFDKTGTLTKGVFEVVSIHPEGIEERELLHYVAHAERYSNHPIAISLKKAYGEEHDDCQIDSSEEISGRGVKAVINNKTVLVGNEKLMRENGIALEPCTKVGTIVHAAIDGQYVGHIVIADVIKETTADAMKQLTEAGITDKVMLTGDKKEIAEHIAGEIGIKEVHSELLPADKVEIVEKKLTQKKNAADVIAFVGDGINDAPVLARADIGIAMGALGSDAAIEAADIVLMDDNPQSIAKAIRIARKSLRIVYENIYFAIGVKLLCLLFSAIGYANMWWAIFADVGVMVIAVLNAVRALNVKNV